MADAGREASSHCTHWTHWGERCCECGVTFSTPEQAWQTACPPARDATPPLHRTPCGPGGHGLPHQPDARGYCADCIGLFNVECVRCGAEVPWLYRMQVYNEVTKTATAPLCVACFDVD